MTESVMFSLADENETISWFQAVKFAEGHSVLEGFFADYASMFGERVDVGELLVWAGY